MAKKKDESLIPEGDVSGTIESGKDSAIIVNDQLNRYDAESNKDR